MSSIETGPPSPHTTSLMEVDQLVQQDPHAHEGLLLPEDWHFDTGVKKITPKSEEEPDAWGNRLSRWKVHMDDGVKLGLNFCEPKERSTDIAVLETPAWLTNLHGFNEYTQRSLGSLGIPSLMVGHVGQERDSVIKEFSQLILKPWQTIQELREISLARQAHNMLEILQYPRLGFGIDSSKVFLHGNSRGGMVQFPELAMANERDIDVVFAMPVAPCFAEGFGKETAKEVLHTPFTEGLNIGRLVMRNLFDLAGSGLNTLNLSPKTILYELAHTESLFNGDAGRFSRLAKHSQQMLILAYRSDLAGQYARWNDNLEDFPNVYVRDLPGAHLSIADKRTRGLVTQIFGNYAEQLREGEHPDSLDHSHIRRHLSAVRD